MDCPQRLAAVPPVFLCMPTMHTVYAPTIRRSKRQGFVRVSSSNRPLSLGPQATCHYIRYLPAWPRLHVDFSMFFLAKSTLHPQDSPR